MSSGKSTFQTLESSYPHELTETVTGCLRPGEVQIRHLHHILPSYPSPVPSRSSSLPYPLNFRLSPSQKNNKNLKKWKSKQTKKTTTTTDKQRKENKTIQKVKAHTLPPLPRAATCTASGLCSLLLSSGPFAPCTELFYLLLICQAKYIC